jgi:hypothetical protein
MPQDFDATEQLLAQVKSMPHTPTEKDAILSRVAAHCKDILPMSSWQFCFGDLSTCEGGDPVSIVINSENYGLLYTLSSVSALTPLQAENKTEEKQVEKPQEKAADTGVTTEEAAKKEDDGSVPLIPLPKVETKVPDKVAEAGSSADAHQEALKTLQNKVTESEQSARLALAHSTALYMKTLRKPFSRNKSSDELIAELSKRSADSLRDTLSDLLAELEAGGTLPASNLPRVADPTKSDPDTTAPKEVATKEAAPSVETPEDTKDVKTSEDAPPPKAKLTPIVEFENDEDEEVFSVLGTLFSDLKIKSNR